jgi:amino acid transporter
VPLFSYLFWPNPGVISQEKSLSAVIVCVLLLVLSFGIKIWRKKQHNKLLRRLSQSWDRMLFWFGLVGLILIVSRIEGIQFVSMRFLWIVWGTLFILIIFIQFKQFRMQYYEVLPKEKEDDPREKYLPTSKKKRK